MFCRYPFPFEISVFVGHYILDDSVVGSVYLVSVRCEDGDVETISMIIMQLSPRPLRPL